MHYMSPMFENNAVKCCSGLLILHSMSESFNDFNSRRKIETHYVTKIIFDHFMDIFERTETSTTRVYTWESVVMMKVN